MIAHVFHKLDGHSGIILSIILQIQVAVVSQMLWELFDQILTGGFTAAKSLVDQPERFGSALVGGIEKGVKSFAKGLPDNAIEVFMEWLSGGILKSLQGVQLPKDVTKWQDWVKFVAWVAGVNPPGLATLLKASESDQELPTFAEVLELGVGNIKIKDVLDDPSKLIELGNEYLKENSDDPEMESIEKIVRDFLRKILVETAETLALRIADWLLVATGLGALKAIINIFLTIIQRIGSYLGQIVAALKAVGEGLKAAAELNPQAVAMKVMDGLKVAVTSAFELLTLALMLGGLVTKIQKTICEILARVRAYVQKIIAWLLKKKKGKNCGPKCDVPGKGAPKAGDVKGGQGCTIPPKMMPMMKCGNCFTEGTPAKNGADLWQQLEEVVLGQRLRTWEPGELGYADSLTIPDTVIDPTTWRALWFVQEHADGYKVEVGMLRPLSWLEERGAAEVGDWVTLDLPEMGVEGAFQLMAVDACPVIEQGEGRVVLSVYRFSKGQTWNLLISGMAEPLGVTALHPIWSADRKDWIAVGELLIGERVLVSGGVQVVLGLQQRGVERVYNVEVDGDHCYRVGELGVLVHNVSNAAGFTIGNGDCEARYMTQTCDNKRLDELETMKNALCNMMAGQSCTGQSVKKLAKIPCADIIARINDIMMKCMPIRELIRDECFGGKHDPGHATAYQQLVNGLAKCRALAASTCPVGTNIP